MLALAPRARNEDQGERNGDQKEVNETNDDKVKGR